MRLALSGGGFRATLFHLGVVRYLREQELLHRITEIYSVSGGTIFAAHLVQNWGAYANYNNDAACDKATNDLLDFVTSDLRGRLVGKWMCLSATLLALVLIPSSQLLYWRGFDTTSLVFAAIIIPFSAYIAYRFWYTRSFVWYLQQAYHVFFDAATVHSLKQQDTPQLVILATNLTNGCPVAFEHSEVKLALGKDKPDPIPEDRIPLSLAVAASSAFPPLFSPVQVDRHTLKCDAAELPHPHYLSDGGVFDNLGVTAVRLLLGAAGPDDLIISDAERRFDEATNEPFDYLVSRAIRVMDIMMLRLSSAEERDLPKSAKLIRLQDDWTGNQDGPFLGITLQRKVRCLRTDLDSFTPLEIQLLYFKGYGAARAVFSGESGPIPGVGMSPQGIPVTAQKPLWLPIAADNPGLAKDADSELQRGSVTRMNRLSPVALLVGALALLLSWPCFPLVVRAYQSLRMTPHTLTTNVIRVGDVLDSKELEGHKWIGEIGSQLQSRSACKTMTDAVILSRCIGWETYGTNTKQFVLSVGAVSNEPVILSDAQAFVLKSSAGTNVRLDCQPSALGWTVVVPECAATDRVAIVVRLCNTTSGDKSLDGDLNKLVTMTVNKGGK